MYGQINHRYVTTIDTEVRSRLGRGLRSESGRDGPESAIRRLAARALVRLGAGLSSRTAVATVTRLEGRALVTPSGFDRAA